MPAYPVPSAAPAMEEALAFLSRFGPDLQNGMTSHAPMAAEALCALGRPEAVVPWLEIYCKGMLPRPTPRERIAREAWRAALARPERVGDWNAFFEEELESYPWQEVLARWVGRLVPGVCTAAAHGVIRVGHAVRSLGAVESPLRRRELGDALAYWAANYQELPRTPRFTEGRMRPRHAIAAVERVPPDQRYFAGSIVSSLEALDRFAPFASVLHLVDVSGDPADLVSEMTEVFARIFLANAHDVLTAIVFVHGVTGIAALGHLVPHLDDATARAALRFGWQASCGLYASFGRATPSAETIEPPSEDVETLTDMAISLGDDHAIKFTEACASQLASNPSPVYLAAVRQALDLLPRAA